MGRTYKDMRRHGHEPRQPQNLGRCASSGGKRCFRSCDDAEAAAARILESNTCNAKLLRAYECPYCKRWHLSSKPLR